MGAKQVEIRCPCCRTQLLVDVLTGTILRSAAPRDVDETGKAVLDEGRWDSARERVGGRATAAADKLEQALESERTKEERLDDLFRKARDKADRRE